MDARKLQLNKSGGKTDARTKTFCAGKVSDESRMGSLGAMETIVPF